MPFITAQKSAEYYSKFKDIMVTLNKDLIRVTGFQPSQIYLKCAGDQYPCIIYSTSMNKTKILMKIDSMFREKLAQANNVASLRFCFKDPETTKIVSFFIPGKISSFNTFKGSNQQDVYMMDFDFSKRPADDLIAILGKLLEVNILSKKRSEIRLTMDEELQKDLSLASRSIKVEIAKIPRMAILKDISFNGARILISGLVKFLIEKPITLYMVILPRKKICKMEGIIIRGEKVEGRKDLAILGIKFNENSLGLTFKTKLNDALTKRQ